MHMHTVATSPHVIEHNTQDNKGSYSTLIPAQGREAGEGKP